jgi:hypothetical protein
MALPVDTILRIAAKVTGGEDIATLRNKFTQLENTAGTLTSKMTPLAGAIRSLIPVATIGGLGALIHKNIETADSFNDLRQQTGISVETLARFSKAAQLSGTDINAVAGSISKLSKGLYEFSTSGKGSAGEALKTLGIDALDSAGKLKSADQIVLEVSNRFKEMPDGVEKTALAMQLFGRSGAQMVPLLNMGGKAIEDLGTKMTGAFAEKADEYNDKITMLTGKVNGLAMGLTVALLPALDGITNAVSFVIDLFTKLPEPVQAVIGAFALLAVGLTILSPLLSGLVTALSILGSIGLGATIAGWLGALGPFVAGFTAALGGLLTWVGTTFIPGLLALFSGPVGWTVLAVAAVVAMAVAFREPLMQWWTWLTGEWLPGVTQSWSDWVATLLARFAEIPSGLQIIAQQIVEGLTMAFQNWWTWLTEEWLPGVLQAWESLAQGVQSLRDRIVSSFSNISEGIKSALDKSKNWLKAFWDYGVSLFSYFGALISKPFVIGINSMVDAVNYVTTVAANAINSFIAGINRMVAAVNVISARIGAPALSYLPTIQTFTISKLDVPEVKLPKGFQLPKGMPSFATGAYVKRPMVAEIGDVAGGEYVLRPDQLVPAAANYVRGARGGDVLSSTSAAPAGAVEVSVNLQTGPVQMLPSGEPGVSLDIVAAMIESGIGQALDQIASAPGRAAMGF